MEDSDRLSQERQDQGGHWLSLNTVPGLLQHSTMWYDPLSVSYTHLTLPTICSV